MPANLLSRWRARARTLKYEVYALYLALRDPRTPWYARVVAALVVGYAFSPLDLVPDFIPVLGYLDDLVLVPLGVALTLRLLPPDVLAAARLKAGAAMAAGKPVNRAAAVVIVVIWLGLAALAVLLVWRMVRHAA